MTVFFVFDILLSFEGLTFYLMSNAMFGARENYLATVACDIHSPVDLAKKKKKKYPVL